MCGIAGFIEKQNKEIALAQLQKMSQSLHHRGPDSHGQYFDEISGLGFAHARLSILDLSPAGHQPMVSQQGRFVICYNGEIYNFAKLKKLLPQDFSYKGHSDTEILVNCVEQLGIERTLREACGMFAIALFDREQKQLILARDRSGQKPLYYSFVQNRLAFASELKALKAYEGWQDEVELENLALFMCHNYIPAPFSIYQNTYKLLPGTYLVFDLDIQTGTIKNLENFSPFANQTALCPQPYWQLQDHVLEERKQFQNPDVAVDQLNKILEEVVQEIMISDVPLGAFLSGGVDSSLVVAVMQKLSSQKVKTFSIGFTDQEYNEAPHAKAVAQHLGTEHTQLYVTPQEAWQVVPQLAQIYDEPFADSSQIPTYLVAQLARREVTVSLSGDGGDELFGGYNRYFMATRVWDKVGQQPRWMKTLGVKSIKALPPQQWDQLFSVVKGFMPQALQVKQLGDKLYKATHVLKASTEMEMYLGIISHWQDINEVVPKSQRSWSILNLLNDKIAKLDAREQMMYLDFCSYLTDDILAKVDRASMAHSLEARIPLLDRRVIEFAWSLPLELKIRNGQGKWLLRQLLYKYVPKELIERPKMGFGVPIGEWIKGPLNDWAETLLSEDSLNRSGYLNTPNIRQRWQEHKSGQRNWHMSLWNVLMFQQWLIYKN